MESYMEECKRIAEATSEEHFNACFSFWKREAEDNIDGNEFEEAAACCNLLEAMDIYRKAKAGAYTMDIMTETEWHRVRVAVEVIVD